MNKVGRSQLKFDWNWEHYILDYLECKFVIPRINHDPIIHRVLVYPPQHMMGRWFGARILVEHQFISTQPVFEWLMDALLDANTIRDEWNKEKGIQE